MTEQITEPEARVYEARYRKIEKEVVPPSALDAARTMSSFEIKRGLRGTWPKVPLVLAGFIVFGFVVQMNQFLGLDAETFWLGSEEISFTIKESISLMLTPVDGPGAIMIIHIAVISAGLISGDLRDRAIDLYFSKIKLRTYFFSKLWASFILTFIGLPLFSLIYYIIAFYKRVTIIEDYGLEFSVMAEVFWKMSVTIVLVTFFLSTLVLVFSAYTSNPVNAGVMFLVFTLVSRVIFEAILYEATQIDFFYALSPMSSLDVIRRYILSPDEISDQFAELSVLTYLLYMGISLFLIYIKLRREKNQ
ncbi:MAG: hypothetical protein ACXAE3_15935 [Candidatus Kariarchaeaceae archaeon]